MYAYTLSVSLVHRRRAFFFARCTQQMKTSGLVPELLRAGAALAGIVGWGVVLALIVG